MRQIPDKLQHFCFANALPSDRAYVSVSTMLYISALAALTIMIAESNPDKKEMMIKVIMNCMV